MHVAHAPEKGVSPSFAEFFPVLTYLFRCESWTTLFCHDSPMDIEVVREFYAAARVEDGSIRVRVRGIPVVITPDVISTSLGVVEPLRHSEAYVDDHEAFMRQEGLWRSILSQRFLPPGTPLQNSSQSTNLLPTEAKILYHILSNTIMPTRDPRKIVPTRLALVHTVMENRSLNVVNFIFNELSVLVEDIKMRSLPFPMLITTICHNSGVRVEPSHPIAKFKLSDLTRMTGADTLPVEDIGAQDQPDEGSGGRGYAPVAGFEDFMTEARVEWENHRAFQDNFLAFQTNQLAFQENQLAYQARQQVALAEFCEETSSRLSGLEEQFQNWKGFYQPPPQGD